MKYTILIAALLSLSMGCSRIETGEVGVRKGFDKQIQPGELLPGSFNQTLIGDVLTFPVKDVQVDVADLHPLASDNSTIQDFDLAVIYSINPTTVSELYVNKNKAFHADTKEGDVLLMYNYVYQLGRNAAYKVTRQYEALKMNDNRQAIEEDIKKSIIDSLQEEKLAQSITIQQVLVRQILPAASIVQSANDLVQSQNRLKQKAVEVETARKEAERIAVLNANKGAIEYMNAMANMNISEGIKEGKVNTIIVPANFNALMLK